MDHDIMMTPSGEIEKTAANVAGRLLVEYRLEAAD
jgi:hypothetical protein